MGELEKILAKIEARLSSIEERLAGQSVGRISAAAGISTEIAAARAAGMTAEEYLLLRARRKSSPYPPSTFPAKK